MNERLDIVEQYYKDFKLRKISFMTIGEYY